MLDMYINYEISYAHRPGIVYETEDLEVEAFSLDHTKPCFGYTMREKPRPVLFHPEKPSSWEFQKGHSGQSCKVEHR